jgi:pimeloyl-ACP methyl ester carboxylesterase
VTVPLDHDRPAGATTRIALARYRATDEQRRIGSVFVNPGGPGGSGVELVLAGFGELMGTRLGGRFDVVGFDPRGVAGSDPLHCFASERALVRYFTGLPVFPYRARQFRTFFNRYSGLAAECLDDRQRVARHMSTADVARDLDLLRRAVGDRRLTYFGVSYGSYLGTTYANLFPGRVRALAIDGVLDPRLWSAGWQIASDRVATQLEFDEFLRLCDAAGPQCALRTPAGSALRWERLARTIRRDPLELPGDFVYTYDYLITDAAVAMYAPEVWGGPGGAAALFDYLADAALAGNARAAEEVARLRARLVEQLSLDVEPVREADYPNGWPDAYFGNHCADAQYPRSFPTWLAIDRYARLGSRFGPFWWWGAAGCARWPLSPDRYAGPWRARTSAPVLVVGNYFDGITAYDGAVAADRLLRNSRLLSYAGWGHTAYLRSECVTRRVDAYLLRGALPPRGAVCRANPNPFLAAPGRQAAKGALLVGLPPAGHLRR